MGETWHQVVADEVAQLQGLVKAVAPHSNGSHDADAEAKDHERPHLAVLLHFGQREAKRKSTAIAHLCHRHQHQRQMRERRKQHTFRACSSDG